MPLGAGEGGDERRRHHQVADAEAREHHVREGADVDHRGRGAQALQRRQRRAAVVVFAVVVVLDHHDASGPRPFEQLEPPRQRHRRAGRELVRRGDEDHARRVGQLGHRDAVALHRHGVQARPVRLEQLPRARVARILDGRDVARVDEHPRTQIERLLRAVDHDDLAGLAPDGPRPPQVRRDFAAQRLVAGAPIRRLPRRRRERSHVAHHEAAPDADRKGLDVGAPFRQVEHARRADTVARTRRGSHPGAVARQADRRRLVDGRGGALPGQRTIRQLARHEAARPALRLQVAFRRQLVVGARHRRPRHVQEVGELARGRDPLARPEAAGQDAVPPLVVDLPVQRAPGAAVQDDRDLHGSAGGGPGPGWARPHARPLPGLCPPPRAQPRASGLYINIRSGACVQSTRRLPYEHAAGAIHARGRPAEAPHLVCRPHVGASRSCKSPSTPTR